MGKMSVSRLFTGSHWRQLPAGGLSPGPSSLRHSCGGGVEVGVGVRRGEVMASTIIILLGFLPILFGFSAL